MFCNDWDHVLKKVVDHPYFNELMIELEKEYNTATVYPPKNMLFTAFKLCRYEEVRVVVIGQDPYHNEGQANGLAFSVSEGVKIPPSLRNIYKEMENDLGHTISKDGDLTYLAKQGFLLINAMLSVRENEPGSHKYLKWERFTDKVIQLLNEKETPVVFVLWGNYAKSKKKFITNSHHLILESAHPSPLSANRGFFGSKPFTKINQFLKANGMTEINY